MSLSNPPITPRVVLTTRTALPALLSGKTSAAFADSAYLSQTYNDRFSKCGVENYAIKQADRNKP